MELNNIDVGENMMVNIHTIDKLMEYKEGGDALMLRFRYYQQRLMQGQQLTYSTDQFMIKAMGWNSKKFKRVKKILKDCGMIDVVMKRDGEKVKGRFVKVNYTFNPYTVRNHTILYEYDNKEQLEQLEGGIIPGYISTQVEKGPVKYNLIENKIQPNLKENIYSPKEIFDDLNDLNSNLPVTVEKEHPQAPVARVDTFDFYDINDPYVQSMMKNKNFKKNNIETLDKLIKKGYSQETIQTVLNFIKQDEFWSKQIRSLPKLLKKNPDGVIYIDVMIDKIKQWKPKCVDLDALYGLNK